MKTELSSDYTMSGFRREENDRSLEMRCNAIQRISPIQPLPSSSSFGRFFDSLLSLSDKNLDNNLCCAITTSSSEMRSGFDWWGEERAPHYCAPELGGDPGLGIVALARIEANFARRNLAIVVNDDINFRALQDNMRKMVMITTKGLEQVLAPLTKERFIRVAAQRAQTKKASIPFQAYGRCDYKNLHADFHEGAMGARVRSSNQWLFHRRLFVGEDRQHKCPRREHINRSGIEGESKETLDEEMLKSMLPAMKRKAPPPQKYQATVA